MTKQVNEGWPDPNEWVKEIKTKLVERENLYRAFLEMHHGRMDPEEFDNPNLLNVAFIDCARTELAMSISVILTALKKLPAFEDDVGLAPIHDLISHLISLGDGQQPLLLKPSETKLASKDNFSRRYVQNHVIFFVKALEQVNVLNIEARKTVASIFTKAGFQGRKGNGRLSYQTIYEWQVKVESEPSDSEANRFLQNKLKNWDRCGAFNLSKDELIQRIEKIADSPLLGTKSLF